MRLSLLLLFSAILYTSITNAQCAWFRHITTNSDREHTVALKSDSTLWSWGKNIYGQLGNGTSTGSATPIQVGTDKWIAVAAGLSHSLGVKADGTLWAWGSNSFKQLGNNNVPAGTQYSPVQIGTATNWVSVAACYSRSFGIRSDGTLWAWGLNDAGILGLGYAGGTVAVPTQIGTDTDWVLIQSGVFHNMAIKSNGTLWGWGNNAYRQLGDGTTVNKESPVQIGTATNWASVSVGNYHNAGLKTDGTLWMWGRNYDGELGDGTRNEVILPKQIGANDWVSVIAGPLLTIGVKGDGSLWGWGKNDGGQLGDGTTVNKVSPAQIGNASNWAWVNATYRMGFIMKTNGAVYAWGNNDAGEFGDGTVISNTSASPAIAAPNFTLPAVTSSLTQTQKEFTLYTQGCNLVASVLKAGGTSTITGSTTAKVWVDNIQAAAFGKRHYEIIPTTNAATATGRITLYFTQQEFTDFNAVNDVKLPVDATDAANNKANLRIEKMTGVSSDGTGLPVTYSGPSTTIDPADANIVWNAANSYWEVTIYTTGFGAFFVKTQPEPLVNPLNKVGLTRATPAAAAWSLRLLSTDYTGAAIRVRRSNDNNIRDIGFTAGGFLDTVTLKNFTGNNNGYVVTWYDQSGSGTDAKQTDVSKQPLIVQAGIIARVNRKPAIYFGAASMATAPLTIFTKAASMVGVAKGNSNNPSTFVAKTGTAAGNNLNYPGPFDYTNPGGEFTVGNAATTAFNLIPAASNPVRSIINTQVDLSTYSFVIPASGTYYNYVNGVQAGNNTVAGFMDGGHSIVLGNRNDGAGAGNFWTPELVLFNLALSTTERQTLEGAQQVLPLEWISVKGLLTKKHTAQLSWQVEERLIKSYTIEKSTNGITYATIGLLSSAGDGVHSYTFTESQILSGIGHYRIKQTDIDGQFTYSTVITLNNQATTRLAIYPNPATAVVTVTTDMQLLHSVATLYNANGVNLQSFTIKNASFPINLAVYPAGVYFLKTADGQTLKIIRH